MSDEQSEFGDAAWGSVSGLLALSTEMLLLRNNLELRLVVKRLFAYFGGPTFGVSQHRIQIKRISKTNQEDILERNMQADWALLDCIEIENECF